MKNLIDYKLPKLAGIILSIGLLGAEVSCLPVYAKTENEQIRDVILDITDELESNFNKQYEEAKQEIIDLIYEKDYDRTMTLETFYDNGNPFKDIDYLKLITQYASIRQYLKDNGKEIGTGFGGIKVLNWKVSEKKLETDIPVIVETYTEVEDGLYERTGNRIINEPTTVPVYEPFTATKYKLVGEEEIDPEKEEITYGEITLSYVGNDILFDTFQVTEEDIADIYDEKYEKYDAAINGKALSESIFVSMPVNTVIPTDIADEIRELNSVYTEEQRSIIRVAISLYGRVPYQWGGKAHHAGYDNTWWTFDESGEQKGLDCSGYVQWVYMTAGYDPDITNAMLSTTTIIQNFEDITEDQLEPGDFGLLNYGEVTNHVGIYIGDGYFIHCSSGANTVTIDKFPFRYFKRVQKNSKNTLTNNTISDYYQIKFTNSEPANDTNANSEHSNDIYLLAQLMIHEAGNQGFNGKVAVGEVVVNRLANGSFGNSIEEIIYSPKQFSRNWEIKEIVPDDETLLMAEQILQGSLSVLNNPDVLFFRNPMITDQIPATDNVAWGIHQWYTCINQHAFYTR